VVVVKFIKDKLPYITGERAVFTDKEAKELIEAGYAVEYVPDVKAAIASNNKMVKDAKIEK